MRRLAAVLLLCVSMVAVSACADETPTKTSDYKKVQNNTKGRHAYIPSNQVEFNNYNNAQKLYDSPTTIIWCTTTWGNNSAPLVTVPIAGKLTSSSVSYFPNTQVVEYSDSGRYSPELRSVDGMYHGSPPPYRYGFTPGGQYVDFSSMPTFCTTALTKFQRQATKVTVDVDSEARSAAGKAEDALKRGDKAAAEKALAGLESGH